MAIRDSAEWVAALGAARNAYIAAVKSLAAVLTPPDVAELIGIIRSETTTECNVANNALRFAVTEDQLAVSEAHLEEWTDAVVAMRHELLSRWRANRSSTVGAVYYDLIHSLPPGIQLAKVVEVLGRPYAEHADSVSYVEGETELQLGADDGGRLEWWKLT